MLLKKRREEEKKNSKKLKLDDRISILPLKQSYTTLNDHKKDGNSKMQARLINPTGSEIGIVDKRIIDNINKQIRSRKEFNQRLSSDEFLTWFKNLEKGKTKPLKFDIINFHSSIS